MSFEGNVFNRFSFLHHLSFDVSWVLKSRVCVLSCSVVSDSLQPHGLYSTRLLCPWDFPGKNTGVGWCFLLQRIFQTQGVNPSLLHAALAGKFFTTEPPQEPLKSLIVSILLILSISLFVSVIIYFMYLGAPMLDVYIYTHIYVLKSTVSDINIATLGFSSFPFVQNAFSTLSLSLCVFRSETSLLQTQQAHGPCFCFHLVSLSFDWNLQSTGIYSNYWCLCSYVLLLIV